MPDDDVFYGGRKVRRVPVLLLVWGRGMGSGRLCHKKKGIVLVLWPEQKDVVFFSFEEKEEEDGKEEKVKGGERRRRRNLGGSRGLRG